MEVPKPHVFNGKSDAKVLDIWHMERFFEAITLTDEATKVCVTTLYLTNCYFMMALKVCRHRKRHLHHRQMGFLQERD